MSAHVPAPSPAPVGGGVRRVVDRSLAGASVVLFALLVLTVSWQVFTRQVLQSPSTWSEELARYVFVWLGLFAAALVFSERGHIAVDVLVRRLPPRGQQVVGVVVQLAILVFALVVLVWGGYRASNAAWTQELASLPTQVGKVYLVMPITGLLIAFYSVLHLVDVVRGVEPPTEGPAAEATEAV